MFPAIFTIAMILHGVAKIDFLCKYLLFQCFQHKHYFLITVHSFCTSSSKVSLLIALLLVVERQL